MNLLELDGNGDASAVQLLSLDSSDTDDMFGEPEISPRVGDEYQAEIPPCQSVHLSSSDNPIHAGNATLSLLNFLIGLPISVTWIRIEADNLKNAMPELQKSISVSNKTGILEVENVGGTKILLRDGNLLSNGEASHFITRNVLGKRECSKPSLEESIHHQKGSGCYLVPASIGDSWSSIEKASFLLGLYIFGKNFVPVKRFMEHKTMGAILLYYYGKFYRSPEYCRWSQGRKMRNKKCVFGQRIFSGLRQHELLSRLAVHVPEECRTALSEVFKTFGEGKMSLEELVSSLKAMVGINILVEAVGIGKGGKQDLTGIAFANEIPRSNQAASMRSEIPTGKDCSLLTSQEIVKFLTGGCRLSKARSSDLFWEAIWPRLLAKGWNSLEPKGQNYTTVSRNSLVFLIPGVKKFSRRKLVKGNHYFDSISDVLCKIASEPGLLEEGVEENEGKKNKEEAGWNGENKVEEDPLLDKRRHCYLQPRSFTRKSNVMKFTIVDTSLADGKPFRVRELRSTPSEISETWAPACSSVKSDGDDSEISTDESGSDDAMLLDQEKNSSKSRATTFNKVVPCDQKNTSFGDSKLEIAISCPNSSSIHLDVTSNPACQEEQLQKVVNYHVSNDRKQENLDHVAPLPKRQRKLNQCSHANGSHGAVNFSTAHKFGQEEKQLIIDTPDLIENNPSQVGSSQDNFSTSEPKVRDAGSNEDAASVECPVVEVISEKPWPRAIIDLNVPQVPIDSEDSIFMTGLKDERDDSTIQEADNSHTLETAQISPIPKPQPDLLCRRQGTRNRPPTARVLEALADGFLTVNRKQKSKGSTPRESSRSKPSLLHAQGSFAVIETSNDVDLKSEESENGVRYGKNRKPSEGFPILPKEN